MTDQPLAALFLTRGAHVGSLGALGDDPRLALIKPDALAPEWVALSGRLSGTIVATREDPLAALAWAVMAGIQGTIAVATADLDPDSVEELCRAGAACCIPLPAAPSVVDKFLTVLAATPGVASFKTRLGALLDPVGHAIWCQGRALKLSDKEFELLYCLSSADGGAVSTEALLIQVWPGKRAGNKLRGLLEFYISQLRRRLGRVGLSDRVATVRDFGYALLGPDDPPQTRCDRVHRLEVATTATRGNS